MRTKEEKYTSVGFSKVGSQMKLSFSKNRTSYAKKLRNAGATDIRFIDLPRPMNRVEAIEYLVDVSLEKAEEKAVVLRFANRYNIL